ncbi:MAG TPA: SDR family oxidoreductase [Streptosporangiaceae bacterium]|jgi:NAD(P)-dependent dehydrogenase (short-subunit alcohol dehydrogenase family)
MQVTDRVAVVTGGASGIGRALCECLAAAGAAGVVVADADGDGAAQVAAGLSAAGHRALAVTADLADEAAARQLVERAEREYGRVDLLCSNAGIIVGGGVEVSNEAWSRIWAINVQSHVYLCRAVLPGMLERGDGYLVFTASAAGLLTQLGSAPYSVTKHALVALAEWLSITYADQGIRVSCLCPQAVRTNLGATSRRELGADTAAAATRSSAEQVPAEPAADRRAGDQLRASSRAAVPQAAVDGILTADQVAASVLDAIGREEFLILPHPEVATYERRRADDRERWLRGMRRLQSRLTASRAAD